jgi:DNA-binding CsgD family transcriptional regulator/alkylhydroperoxidase/carboxymuconolactone decarboxylase family protein YurZ
VAPPMARATARSPVQTVRGRDAELTVLGQQLDQVLAGIGSVVLVEGGAGMGKSRLLGEVAEMARRLSIRVGGGVADPGDTVVQLSVLMEALFEGPSPILERTALGDAHASPEQRYWLLQDLEALLEGAALNRPLLICLDDAQWADSGTAAALRALPSRLATVPIGWVVALRPGHGSPQVRSAVDFLEAQGAAKIALGPLDQSGVAQMAADVLGAEPDVELLKMAERPGGSPFLLVELLSGLCEEGLVRLESGRAELVEWRLPHRVSESMRLRLERMSDSARQVATVAAAMGRRFSLDDVAAMLNLSPSELLAPVDELIRADLLAECDGRLMFGHDLTLEAVRASIPGSVRRSLDRQAASVLLARGALPVEVAKQLAESASPGDEVAITTLFRAAEALGATDPGAAADLSQRALELAPRRHPLRGPLVAQTAVWLHAAGRGEEAKAFADTALHEAFPPEQEAEVRLSIAGMFALSSDVRAEECRHALALPGLPANLRARHLALLLHNLVTAGRFDGARAMLEEVALAVHGCDDVAARFALELAESGLMYAGGDFPAALALVETALRTGLRTSDDTRGHLTYQWRCDVLTMVDRLDESLQMSTEGVASAQRDRQAWALSIFETGRGRQLLQMGRLADAAVALEGQLPVDLAPHIVSVLDAAGVVALGRVAIHLGDPGLSRQAREIAHVMLDQRAPSVRRHAAWLLALQEMAAGDPARAHEWLRALGDEGRMSIVPLFPMDVADEARLIHIALAARDHELASHAVDAAQRRAQRNPQIRSMAAAAAHAKGLLDHNRKELVEAVALYEGGPRPLACAAALEDLGVATVDGGDRGEGVEVFGRALELYAEAGAAWDAGRVRGRLRALGVRRRLVAAPRPGRGWAAMTDTELAVARLVAQGLTNREVAERLFVSQHTVNGHLRHVFAKLDVNSRVELTRLASVHDPRL